MIQRSTYSTSAGSAQALGGQPIAVRVSGDPVTANNGIFYFHTDQLGSTSVMTKHSNGNILSGSLARYTPFGDWRTEPSADLTDRGFTGHMSNNTGSNDLGLIYMNARFYVPSLNRFASADTIVPDPMNPQSLNRYTYTQNNPLNRVDPSGHQDDECDSGCGFTGNTWLGEWLGWDVVGKPDAYAWGISASASFNTPLVSVEGNIAREEVYDPDTQQRTTFLVIGGDISIGPDGGFIEMVKEMWSPKEKPNPLNFSVSPYIASIYNVEDVVADYSGPFIYNSTTAAYKYGLTAGEAHSPRDPERERAYSNTAGLVFGYALTTNHGGSYYIPIKTHTRGQVIPTFHNPLPYIGDLVSTLFGD